MLSFKTANTSRLLIRGLIAIVIGLTVVIVPDLSMITVMQVLGALLIVDGVIALLVHYTGKNKSSLMLIPRGVSNLFFGIVLLVFPSTLVSVFIFVVGLILILAGLSQLANVIGNRNMFGFSWVLTIISIIALASGILLLAKPFESAETILTFFGIIIFLYGVGEIFWSFKVRKAQKQNPDKSAEIVDADYEEIEE